MTPSQSARSQVSVTVLCLLLFAFCVLPSSYGQSASATLSGTVEDQNGAVVPGATVTAENKGTGLKRQAITNGEGYFTIPLLPPSIYSVTAQAQGFSPVQVSNVVLNVGDQKALRIQLKAGDINATVQVINDAPLINESPAVSTVIDRRFVENLPLNGRSFNTLLQLTPGVVIAPVTPGQTGQFSVAGQRTDANNFTVDGVSANFGVGAASLPGETGTGGAQAFSVLGSTSSLVSVDALQEFRIETASFAPEFGRTPGGQVMLSTRSGTNGFHGGAFEYFRNDALDASDWFANAARIPKAKERHNDFGGFLGGPIRKNRTFFFFSYEAARLRLPQTVVIQVPSIAARTSAPAALAVFLNAYPQPNGPVSSSGNAAQFTGSLSNPATLNATSVRIDHSFNERFSIFGRLNYAPSLAQDSFGPSTNLSNPRISNLNTKTLTVGSDMVLSPKISNALRANYSTQINKRSASLNSFGGAVPISPSLLLGTLAVAENAGLFQTFDIASYILGVLGNDQTKQVNLTDALAISARRHQVKFGVDYRAILLDVNNAQNTIRYTQSSIATFLSSGSVTVADLAFRPSQFVSRSFSAYAQDTWKARPRLTLTYGVRWEIAPAPSGRGGTTLAAFQNVNDPASTVLAPIGSPLWATTYGNLAPRFGLAYSFGGDFVLRAGGGIFYDLGVGTTANLAVNFPNGANKSSSSVPLPVTDVTPLLATNFSLNPPYGGRGFDPNLVLPRSYQWNVAVEKSFGGKQVMSATYVGSTGRDLLRNAAFFQPNSNFKGNDFFLTQNSARSNYNGLQLQFRRPLWARLQALFNYSWSHSLDNASDDLILALPSNVVSAASDYASSNFDVRHSFSGAVSYDIPAAGRSGALALLTRNWSLQSVIVARSGFPFNGVILIASPDPLRNARSRPDRVPGQPVWISDSTAGGGKSLNPSAFLKPSTIRQGTEGRNDLRSFGLSQVDLSISRKIAITERVNLQVRADAFNAFNHPNFAKPSGFIEFGASGLKSPQMASQGLGGLSPLFQEGGPRSLQLSLKLTF